VRVLLFPRLAQLKRDILARLTDKRRARRHPVGSAFPLKASVSLVGSEFLERVRNAPENSACMSATVASLVLPRAAISVRGEPTTLKLTIEHHELLIPAEVVRFVVLPTHSICGLRLSFANPVQRAAYLQLLEAVILGSTLKPWQPTGLVRNPPGLVRERYKGEQGTVLTVWRRKEDKACASFELRLHKHLVRGEAGSEEVEIYTPGRGRGGRAPGSAPGFRLSGGDHAEVRQLFRWVAPNLNHRLAADMRAFVASFKA
jgi:hypothetical protein